MIVEAKLFRNGLTTFYSNLFVPFFLVMLQNIKK